jgi:mRNA interferase YafQ
MKALRFGGAFRKDLKRIAGRGYDRERLDLIVDALRQGSSLPASVRPHPLKGEWKGHWECHIAPDWLLIYKVSDSEVVLARTGTHSDLFKR